MKSIRFLAMIGMLGIAIILAFPLRYAVYSLVIVPVAYVLWILDLIYRSVDQVLWWFVLLFIVLVVFSKSLLPQFKVRKLERLKAKPKIGQVEGLSIWIKKAGRGTYFKWLVANRLGKIAHQILVQRDTSKQRSAFSPLSGPDWDPQTPVQAYLETGLHGSFTDYPQKYRFIPHSVSTPMDHDVSEVIEYLETQIED
jgi:hypothetical protein